VTEFSVRAHHANLRYREIENRLDKNAIEPDVAEELQAVLMICLDHRGEAGVERILDRLVTNYFGEALLQSIK